MKYRRTRLNSEVVILEKILFVEETHDKKKEEVKPKISYMAYGIGSLKIMIGYQKDVL